ncbi:hypothetical protein ACTXT7_002892 [Hymenolepis weldensis]
MEQAVQATEIDTREGRGREARIVQRYSKRESELVDDEPVDIQGFENESDLNLQNKNGTLKVLFNDKDDIDELISQATDQPTEEVTNELADENLANHSQNQQQYQDTNLEKEKFEKSYKQNEEILEEYAKEVEELDIQRQKQLI